ncbi:DUF3307 domain-containing protein [Chryseotalea sanaruensis]|uniref:DUF3307 domain-containing protein n=1 Tax=Chryseotalea sanaruensis TaxID=2482724 RepID=A0A401U665_9BACT|nr:DUF3307 domain-containing protein [Chryseotalea sanaruensis]GCC50296.1 DUF3307 domain-containing protein [Chryseotalea sanaruensis]
MILLIKLVLTHLLGDFILQPASWVKAKEKKKLKAWQLYAHMLIHFILIMLLVWDITFMVPALSITLSHGIIDAVKLHYQKKSTERIWFVLDQLFHLAIIVTVWYHVESPVIVFDLSKINLLYITAVIFITTPASIIIKTLISQWSPVSNKPKNISLQHAGKYIGVLERLLVFTFVVTDNWEAVGFLIAAKSVFRFGDLKDSRELKLTEYVLIGTLLSFGLAVGTGLLINFLDKSY